MSATVPSKTHWPASMLGSPVQNAVPLQYFVDLPFAPLLQACERMKASFMCCCITAIAEAAALVSNETAGTPSSIKSVAVTVVSDVRNSYSPPLKDDPLGYHVGITVPLTCETDGRSSNAQVWESTRVCKRSLLQSHENKEPQLSAPTVATGFALGKLMYLSPQPTFNMSNIGALPFVKQYGAWTLEASRTIINTVHHDIFHVWLGTYNGVMTLSFVSNTATTNQETLARVGLLTKARLNALVAGVEPDAY